jgi:putative oxidoreductase
MPQLPLASLSLCYYRFMLNTFPELLNYSILAPFILRIVIGLIFVDLGILKFKGERKRWMETFEALKLKPSDILVSIYGLIQIIGGIMLILGIWTQIAALIFVIFTAIELSLEWTEGLILKRDIVFYVLLFSISLSLLLTGAGAFAIDLPL